MAVITGMGAPDNTEDVYTSSERLYLDAAGNVVKANSAKRVSLLVAEAATIPGDLARQHGLMGEVAAEGAPDPEVARRAEVRKERQQAAVAEQEVSPTVSVRGENEAPKPTAKPAPKTARK